MRIVAWSSDVCSSDLAVAKEGGVGLAGVRRSGHFGTSSYYLTQAVESGCIGMSFTTSSPALAPAGAAERLLGTSPFGFAAPTTDDRTFLIDMAMSRVARGKLKFAAQRGEQVPLRSEEHTSELQSLMRISYAVFCFKKK